MVLVNIVEAADGCVVGGGGGGGGGTSGLCWEPMRRGVCGGLTEVGVGGSDGDGWCRW